MSCCRLAWGIGGLIEDLWEWTQLPLPETYRRSWCRALPPAVLCKHGDMLHQGGNVEDREEDREESAPHADPEVVGQKLQIHLVRWVACKARAHVMLVLLISIRGEGRCWAWHPRRGVHLTSYTDCGIVCKSNAHLTDSCL